LSLFYCLFHSYFFEKKYKIFSKIIVNMAAVGNVIGAMGKNIAMLLSRGLRLDALAERSTEMGAAATAFTATAATVASCTLVSSIIWTVMIVLALLLLGLVVGLPVGLSIYFTQQKG
jgi:hypothetical protein